MSVFITQWLRVCFQRTSDGCSVRSAHFIYFVFFLLSTSVSLASNLRHKNNCYSLRVVGSSPTLCKTDPALQRVGLVDACGPFQIHSSMLAPLVIAPGRCRFSFIHRAQTKGTWHGAPSTTEHFNGLDLLVAGRNSLPCAFQGVKQSKLYWRVSHGLWILG